MAGELQSHIPDFPNDSVERFPAQRVRAEQYARERTQNEEVTLAEIYVILAGLLELPTALAELLQFMEAETELRLARPVPAVVDEIDALEKKGRRVIFISDFYHRTSFVRALLKKVGVSTNDSQVYVSSEIGVSKASGNLFRHVLIAEKCRPSDILHKGDNRISDVKIPESLGIRVHHFADAQLTRYESLLSNPGQLSASSLLLHQMAGASRDARLSDRGRRQGRSQTLFEIGASVAAPLLVPFVSWVISRAESALVSKLYFVARDGQILKLIADRLLAKSGKSIRTGYLYGSRQAWHLPAVRQIDDRALAWILNLDNGLTVRSLATRVGIDATLLCGQIAKRLSRRVIPDSPVLRDDLPAIAQSLRSEEVSKPILLAANEAREGMLHYLAQVGFVDHARAGIVDIGWHGNLQTSLVTVLESLPTRPLVSGWYLGLRSGHRYARDDLQVESFVFGPTRSTYTAEIMKWANFLEIFCAADHGGTLGYRQTPTGWTPVLNPLGGQGYVSWGLRDLRDGILSFVEFYNSQVTDAHSEACAMAAASLLNALGHSPTHNEAEAIGSFPFSTDQIDSTRADFAPVMRIFGNPPSLNDIYRHDCWFGGVLMRSNPVVLCIRALMARNREVFIHGLRRIGGVVGLSNKDNP